MSLVRGEVLKLTRQLSLWLMLLGALGLLGVVSLGVTTAGSDRLKDLLAHNPSLFIDNMAELYETVFQLGSGIFLLIVSVRLFAMEYSSGTIRILYARGVGRLQLLLTKFAVLLVLGVLLLAGYLLLSSAIVALTVNAWSGSLTQLDRVSAAEWQNVRRAVEFAAANLVVLVLLAAAVAGLGRSLSFALPAALALFPADNFATVLLLLASRATGQSHPWLDINQWFLGPNLNVILSLWETTHPRPAFAVPLVTVSLTHAVWVVIAWSAGLAAIALYRTLRPDVLE